MSSLLLANHYCFLNANCQITFFIQQNISTETLKKFDYIIASEVSNFIFRVKIFEFQHQNSTLESIIFGRENSNMFTVIIRNLNSLIFLFSLHSQKSVIFFFVSCLNISYLAGNVGANLTSYSLMNSHNFPQVF